MSDPVGISGRAESDIRQIQNWIKERSESGARNRLAALELALVRLSTAAVSCCLAPESELLQINLRQMMFKTRRGNPYRLLFVQLESSIEVVAVRGFGRDLLQPGDVDVFE